MVNQQEKDKISEAVRQAELTTSGEIVPMIISRSDDYPGARWRVAIAFSLFTAFSLYLFFPQLNGNIYLWIQFPALALGYFLSSIQKIQRHFLSQNKMTEEVYQRAIQAFYTHGLSSTRDRTGILIMISLLEHRVVILADSGINSKVPENTWPSLIDQLLHEIKNGQLVHGLCGTIRECGEILSRDFPRLTDDSNELPNRVIIE